MISLCITLKNRAKLLDIKLNNIKNSNFDTKQIEVCISDGNSSDNLKEIIEKWYKEFYQIKYAISDRTILPFEIKTNDPACDWNALVANMPTFNKIILSDPEVVFIYKDQLKWIDNTLNKDLCIWHSSFLMKHRDFTEDYKDKRNIELYCRGTSGRCLAFLKNTFMQNRGFEEKFALGFAGEDNYFIERFKVQKKEMHSPYPIIHLWHPSPVTKENLKLRDTYTLPLLFKLRETYPLPNENNPNWTRPEMLKNIEVFK